jgi:hypothetical protein
LGAHDEAGGRPTVSEPERGSAPQGAPDMSVHRLAIVLLFLLAASKAAVAAPPGSGGATDVNVVNAVATFDAREPFQSLDTGPFTGASVAWVANVGPVPSGRRLVVDTVNVFYPAYDYVGPVAPCRLYVVTTPITAGAIDPSTIEFRLQLPAGVQRTSRSYGSNYVVALKRLTAFVDEGRYLAARCEVPTDNLTSSGTFSVTGFLE